LVKRHKKDNLLQRYYKKSDSHTSPPVFFILPVLFLIFFTSFLVYFAIILKSEDKKT